MTACVNNEKEIKGGVSGKVLRTVAAGVLAMSMMPAAALAAPAADGAEAAPLAVQNPDFTSVTFTWSVAPDASGDYSVEAGVPFYVTAATDIYGNPVPASDYQVLYVASDGGLVYTSAPTKPGNYVAYLIEGGLDKEVTDAIVNGKTTWTGSEFDDTAGGKTSLSAIVTKISSDKKQTQDFEILYKSLEGAYFFQDGNTGDKTFKFTGNPMTYGIADASGNELEKDVDYQISWINEPATETNGAITPGTYTARINGIGEYNGNIPVSFTVDKIDLAKDDFTIAPVALADTAGLFNSTSVLEESSAKFTAYVNGEELADGYVDFTAFAKIDDKGEQDTNYLPNAAAVNNSYKILLKATADSSKTTTANKYFVSDGATGSAQIALVDQIAKVTYDGVDAANVNETFDLSKGEGFDPALIEATITENLTVKDVSKTVKVYKDGVEVESYDEPGTYKVVVTVDAPKDNAYAALVTFDFKVVARQLSAQPVVYGTVDGKALTEPVEYDGDAVVPEFVVKAGTKTLAEGEDYTVTYKDALGNAVDSVVEPGTYTGTVDFLGAVLKANGNKVESETFTLTVEKAWLESAKADQSVYAYTGDVVTPTFTAWTDEDFEGMSVTVDPAVTGVTYYEVKGYDANGKLVLSDAIKASSLKDEGTYVAMVNAPADDAHIQGSVQSEPFEISEVAKYDDVDAGAWYGDSVYKATELDYMSGVSGTHLFMPNAPISREQIANVLFRMAGAVDSYGKDVEFFPTKFSDVEGWAWYAKPISWAYEAGVMGGYGDTDVFGVGDEATREQVAAIFYNYAKSQGKDVTVADEAAALAKVNDADTISDWAKTAVAWAVENGIMGNGGSVWAQSTITRAEVAAMAVNFQPERIEIH